MLNIVEIDYTSWRGIRRVRKIHPLHLIFSKNEWHTEMQWMLEATDIETGESRCFAMKNIHSWKPSSAD